jgi:metal-responsive CopG/Arc/MetJ family transcriptional regulator
MHSKKIQVVVTSEMLDAIDEAAAKTFQSRSQYIRETLALRLNNQHVVKKPSED